MAEVSVGQEAPDFTLPDDANQKVHLADLRGNIVVLMFYPLDFSPVCTNEMCDMRDHMGSLSPSGAKLFGISRDSVWTHKAFKAKEGLQFSLLADMKGDVARAYGAWNEQAGIAERLTVVVDKDGKVAFTDRSPSIPTARDMQKMIDAVGKVVA